MFFTRTAQSCGQTWGNCFPSGQRATSHWHKSLFGNDDGKKNKESIWFEHVLEIRIIRPPKTEFLEHKKLTDENLPQFIPIIEIIAMIKDIDVAEVRTRIVELVLDVQVFYQRQSRFRTRGNEQLSMPCLCIWTSNQMNASTSNR